MWLLEPSTFQRLETFSNNVVFTKEQQEKFEAKYDNDNYYKMPTILYLNNNVATIKIEGILTQKMDLFAFLFEGGNTTYPEIVSAIETAESNDSIEEIILEIDSPGGHFDGLFEVIETLQIAEKPITTKIGNLCTSAAYAIAAQSHKIIASNIASRIGSIGILASFFVYEREVTITSSAAPKKAPDVKTLEGVKIVTEQLDAMHQVFVDAIAVGRNTTSEKINEYYGKGSVFLAQEAQNVGMIDSISMPKKSQKTDLKIGAKMEIDIGTLKANHRDIYDAVFKLGVEEERDRVAAHLLMGQSSGDMKTAIKAVEEGSQMTQLLTAKYLATSMNGKDIENRETDNPKNIQTEKPQDNDIGAQVATLLEAKMGITGD